MAGLPDRPADYKNPIGPAQFVAISFEKIESNWREGERGKEVGGKGRRRRSFLPDL
jgi:hypothetical protein